MANSGSWGIRARLSLAIFSSAGSRSIRARPTTFTRWLELKTDGCWRVIPEVRLRESRLWSNELDLNKTYAAPNWTYLSALWDENRFLLGGRTGMLVEGFKTNGTSSVVWQTLADSIRNWLWDVTRMPDFYVAVGDFGTVMTSENGLNWDLEGGAGFGHELGS